MRPIHISTLRVCVLSVSNDGHRLCVNMADGIQDGHLVATILQLFCIFRHRLQFLNRNLLYTFVFAHIVPCD